MRQLHVLKSTSSSQALSQVQLMGHSTLPEPQTANEKIELFLSLFRAREDVYPKRWENLRTQKSGYSPVCLNEWVKPICNKPKVKCSDCSHQNFPPLDISAAESHLRGSSIIGTYAILANDTCVFLACDFDETTWKIDVATYRDEARNLGIEVAVERSRSGNGAHAWIFLNPPFRHKLLDLSELSF